jgi:hypothetical protein
MLRFWNLFNYILCVWVIKYSLCWAKSTYFSTLTSLRIYINFLTLFWQEVCGTNCINRLFPFGYDKWLMFTILSLSFNNLKCRRNRSYKFRWTRLSFQPHISSINLRIWRWRHNSRKLLLDSTMICFHLLFNFVFWGIFTFQRFFLYQFLIFYNLFILVF